MKHLTIAFGGILLFGLSVSNIYAVDFGSFVNELKNEADKHLKKNQANTQPKTATRPQKLSPASTAQNKKKGNTKQAHAYEGALTMDDKTCKQLVEPFELTRNASTLLNEIGKSSGDLLMKNLLSGNKQAPREAEVLEIARTKAKKLNWMPMEQEVLYGQALHEERLKADLNLIPRSKKGRVKRLYQKADDTLKRILSEVTEQHPYQFKLFLIDNHTINAEAFPGGYLYVNTGVLESDYTELVVAHEIAHVLKRHQTRETQATLIDSVETYEDLKALLDTRQPSAAQVAQRVASLHGVILNFSRQQELQADACSVRIAGRIPGIELEKKIDPYIASMGNEIKPDKKLRGKTSTHPNYPERKKRMKEVVLASKSNKYGDKHGGKKGNKH
jgi:Zn-dependent protease with chaperone function